jgi:hypothetical protein
MYDMHQTPTGAPYQSTLGAPGSKECGWRLRIEHAMIRIEHAMIRIGSGSDMASKQEGSSATYAQHPGLDSGEAPKYGTARFWLYTVEWKFGATSTDT